MHFEFLQLLHIPQSACMLYTYVVDHVYKATAPEIELVWVYKCQKCYVGHTEGNRMPLFVLT